MTVQLGRDWSLEVFTFESTEGRLFGPPLQISFSVEQGITRGMDKATITLLNLNPDSLGFLRQTRLKILLRAGYDGGVGLIFAGEVSKRGVRSAVVTTKDSTDRVTTIEAGTGEITMQNTRFDRSFGRDTTNLTIIDEVARALGVEVRDRAVIPELTYLTGFSYAGPIGQALDALAKDMDTTWSLQGETLIMMPVDVFSPERVALVSASTGLIGRAVENVDGLEFRTLLNPALRPGRGAVVNAIGIKDGRYRLDKVKHAGDFRGSTWFSECFSRYLGTVQ